MTTDEKQQKIRRRELLHFIGKYYKYDEGIFRINSFGTQFENSEFKDIIICTYLQEKSNGEVYFSMNHELSIDLVEIQNLEVSEDEFLLIMKNIANRLLEVVKQYE